MVVFVVVGSKQVLIRGRKSMYAHQKLADFCQDTYGNPGTGIGGTKTLAHPLYSHPGLSWFCANVTSVIQKDVVGLPKGLEKKGEMKQDRINRFISFFSSQPQQVSQ